MFESILGELQLAAIRHHYYQYHHGPWQTDRLGPDLEQRTSMPACLHVESCKLELLRHMNRLFKDSLWPLADPWARPRPRPEVSKARVPGGVQGAGWWVSMLAASSVQMKAMASLTCCTCLLALSVPFLRPQCTKRFLVSCSSQRFIVFIIIIIMAPGRSMGLAQTSSRGLQCQRAFGVESCLLELLRQTNRLFQDSTPTCSGRR